MYTFRSLTTNCLFHINTECFWTPRFLMWIQWYKHNKRISNENDKVRQYQTFNKSLSVTTVFVRPSLRLPNHREHGSHWNSIFSKFTGHPFKGEFFLWPVTYLDWHCLHSVLIFIFRKNSELNRRCWEVDQASLLHTPGITIVFVGKRRMFHKKLGTLYFLKFKIFCSKKLFTTIEPKK